jgi:hypothetical protein
MGHVTYPGIIGFVAKAKVDMQQHFFMQITWWWANK